MGKRADMLVWAPLPGHSPAPRHSGQERGVLGLRRKTLCRYILNMQIRKGGTLETAKGPLPGHRRAEEGAGKRGQQRMSPRREGGQGPCANLAHSWPLPHPRSHLSAQLAGCLSPHRPEQCGPTGAPRNHVSKQVSTLSRAFPHLIWISGYTFKVGLNLQVEKPQFRELRGPGQEFR